MPDNVNITVNETIENVVINPSITNEVIDVDVFATTETVNIEVTPSLTIVNINSVTGGGLVTSVNGEIGDVVIPTSDNNFTTALKTKLDNIQAGAEVNVNADWNATSGDAQILNKPTIPSTPTLQQVTEAGATTNVPTVFSTTVPIDSDIASVKGESDNGIGVYGNSINSYGVIGESINAIGVAGFSDNSYGVIGESINAIGVAGFSDNSYGVYGNSDNNVGVIGESINAIGVAGFSDNSYGVIGSSENNIGVFGYSNDNVGVYGNSDNNVGVIGESINAIGVAGFSDNSYGVIGFSLNNTGVSGNSANSVGGKFNIGNAISNIVEFQKNNILQASITHDGKVNANAFIKSGGTSSQFLKADGSVDSNTYLTSATGFVPYLGATTAVNLGTQNFYTNGNVGILTTTPTAKLHINAPGALSTDIAFRIRNSADTVNLLSVAGNGNVTSLNGFTIGSTLSAAGIFPSGTSTRETVNIRSGLLPSDTGPDIVLSNGQGDAANLSSTRNLVNISRGFNPTSGNGIYNLIQINPTINQTGGANGISRGLFVNPTLTAAADFRAIETTVGNVILNSTSGSVAIGTSTPVVSAKLTIESTTQGFLPPRMTTTQRNAIATPANGLVVYDSTLLSLYQYSGTTWKPLLSSVGISNLTATGTANSTTFLRGDNVWDKGFRWFDYVLGKTNVIETAVSGGVVQEFSYAGTTEKRYRFIGTTYDSATDIIYTNFSGGVLSNPVAYKLITL